MGNVRVVILVVLEGFLMLDILPLTIGTGVPQIISARLTLSTIIL